MFGSNYFSSSLTLNCAPEIVLDYFDLNKIYWARLLRDRMPHSQHTRSPLVTLCNKSGLVNGEVFLGDPECNVTQTLQLKRSWCCRPGWIWTQGVLQLIHHKFIHSPTNSRTHQHTPTFTLAHLHYMTQHSRTQKESRQ